MRRSFLERSIESLHEVADRALFAETIARTPGFLQTLDARVKVAGILALILAVTLSHNLGVIAAIFGGAMILAAVSRIRMFALLARVWLIAFAFTAIAVLPALVLTPGDVALALPYGLAITQQGVRTVSYLLARVLTTTTLSLLLVVSTRWSDLLRALRAIGVPLVFVAILGMTYRYIFLLLQIASELFEGRRSRRVARLSGADARRMAQATAGALLSRTIRLSDEVYLAMQSRGFRGEVYVLDPPRMKPVDWLALATFAAATAAAILAGR